MTDTDMLLSEYLRSKMPSKAKKNRIKNRITVRLNMEMAKVIRTQTAQIYNECFSKTEEIFKSLF